MSTNKMFAWQETKPGLAIITVLDLLLGYMMISFALDSGSLIDYFLAVVFFGLAILHAVKFLKKVAGR